MISPNEVRVPEADESSIIEAIRDFIRECPYLPEYTNMVNVDYLGTEEDSFGIESYVAEPLIRKYIDGSALMQYQFYFTSRWLHSADVAENIKNSKFYELFSEWLRLCTENHVLPILDSTRHAMEIRAITQGYVFSADNSRAQYMIQCSLKYYKSN